MNKNPGVLYIVPTPIGNLQDMTLRAIEILKSVQLIAAEDTRHSLPLLRNFSIQTPLFSLHDHNEREKSDVLLNKLKQGESIALISDAGTPLISDPGYFLVKEARNAGIKVVPIPGPCAAIVALSAAGLPTDRFIFEGFLPGKNQARLNKLKELRDETRTLIFYEAPHRVLEVLENMRDVFGAERIVVIARELTKTFETIYSAPLSKLVEWVAQDENQQRGEIVLLVQGAEPVAQSELFSSQKLLSVLLAELPLKQAVDLAVKLTGEKKNVLYELALKLKNAE